MGINLSKHFKRRVRERFGEFDSNSVIRAIGNALSLDTSTLPEDYEGDVYYDITIKTEEVTRHAKVVMVFPSKTCVTIMFKNGRKRLRKINQGRRKARNLVNRGARVK